MVLVKYITALILTLLALASCDNQKSLEEYLVEKQDDDKFLKVDVAASLLQSKTNTMTREQKDILATIEKVNVVAYPVQEGKTEEYKTEKQEVKSILDQEEYKLLIKMGSNNKGATVSYTGEEDAIDEVVIFANDKERGFAVLRVLGEDMRPDQMIKLMRSVEKGDLDISKLQGIGEIFKD